jgi:hypothetical protein
MIFFKNNNKTNSITVLFSDAMNQEPKICEEKFPETVYIVGNLYGYPDELVCEIIKTLHELKKGIKLYLKLKYVDEKSRFIYNEDMTTSIKVFFEKYGYLPELRQVLTRFEKLQSQIV